MSEKKTKDKARLEEKKMGGGKRMGCAALYANEI